jgi:TolA-binding protein
LIELEETLKAERVDLQRREEELAGLQGRVECVKAQGTLREKELREQWEENVKTFEYRLSQK